MSCVCHAFASVHCCLVVSCWKRVDLLALACDLYCDFVPFLCGILGHVWYFIVSIPDLCQLSYYYIRTATLKEAVSHVLLVIFYFLLTAKKGLTFSNIICYNELNKSVFALYIIVLRFY